MIYHILLKLKMAESLRKRDAERIYKYFRDEFEVDMKEVSREDLLTYMEIKRKVRGLSRSEKGLYKVLHRRDFYDALMERLQGEGEEGEDEW